MKQQTREILAEVDPCRLKNALLQIMAREITGQRILTDDQIHDFLYLNRAVDSLQMEKKLREMTSS